MRRLLCLAILASLFAFSAASAGDLGACCLCDGSCIMVTQEECSQQEAGGGGYVGDGTICDPDPCAQPAGSCCLDGACLELGDCRQSCENLGGTYVPDLLCWENDCLPTPTEETTWGELKHLYR